MEAIPYLKFWDSLELFPDFEENPAFGIASIYSIL
jgi:hypothetical protein